MLKKLLVPIVLGASMLGTLAVDAATVGPYVMGQLGYADTHMDSKTGVLTDYKGKYFDLKIGSSSTDKNNNGIAGRLAIGYQFNPNVAAELGFIKTRTERLPGSRSGEGVDYLAGQFKLDQNVFDLAAKGILPFANGFNAYAKAGVAYINTCTKFDTQFKITEGVGRSTTFPLNSDINVAQHQWAPEAALGISYDILPSVPVDLSWTHIHPFGKNAPGNIDFISFGLGYNFG